MCWGTNHNFIIACYCLRVLNENEQVKPSTYCLSISEHSVFSNDRDLGNIEKSKGNKRFNLENKPVSGADQVFKKTLGECKANGHPGFCKLYEKYQPY